MVTHSESINAVIDATEAFYGKFDHGIHRRSVRGINRGGSALIVRIGCQGPALFRSFCCPLGIDIRKQCAFDTSFSKRVGDLSPDTAGRLSETCQPNASDLHEKRGSWRCTYANDKGKPIKSELGHFRFAHGQGDSETKQDPNKSFEVD